MTEQLIQIQETKSGKKSSKAAFNWQDPLSFDSLLTEDETIIQTQARQYCQKKLLPRIIKANRDEIFDPAIYLEMGEMGFLGSTLSGYGCADTSYVAYGLIAREVERIDSSYRSALSVQSSLVMYPIHSYASETLKEELLQYGHQQLLNVSESELQEKIESTLAKTFMRMGAALL
ncbi:MAG: acyl-CoA dehydrogenase family protein, partial [Alphaproteobacteria bacterium]|nr:acyl-CoA dehydrogenase family protein [Alphaproteobacteria bacterium]